MLYLSRVVGLGHSQGEITGELFGVVNPHTGIEKLVNATELTCMGEDILGVDPNAFVCYLPYQPPETYTAHQIKLKAVCGVDVRVYNGMMTAVLADWNLMPDLVRLRVSNFCSVLTPDVVFVRRHIHNKHKFLVLVLDDSVELDGDVFTLLTTFIRFDVSAVSDVSKVLDTFSGVDNIAQKCIIDRKGRVGRLSFS